MSRVSSGIKRAFRLQRRECRQRESANRDWMDGWITIVPRDYTASLRATRRVYGPASPVNSLRPNATASPPGVPRPVDSVDGLAADVCVLGGPALPWPCPGGGTLPPLDGAPKLL